MVAERLAPEPYEVGMVFSSFAAYWFIDLSARRIWPCLLPAELFKNPKNVMMLGRHTMDVFACLLFVYLAWDAEQDTQFQAMSELPTVKRVYQGHPTCQMLVLCQIAYQIKNTIDSYVCGDGIVFYLHHIGTLVLCMLATYPFLHYQVPYFIGYIEISTALLCVLGLCDDDHGVVGFGAMYPKMKITFGVLFAPAFILLRCIIWPFKSYYFWLDMLAVIEAGPHSMGAVVYALVINGALTLLQFYWLLEIIQTGRKELPALIDDVLGKSKGQ